MMTTTMINKIYTDMLLHQIVRIKLTQTLESFMRICGENEKGTLFASDLQNNELFIFDPKFKQNF